MPKVVLVTGATGKQGGSVIRALAKDPNFIVLAISRNASSSAAREVSRQGQNIRMVQADLNDIPALFAAARDATSDPIWGVFSVQTSTGKQSAGDIPLEVKQGCGMIDEAVKNNVKHFVYSSVERGGDEHSWENPTSVLHFQTKHTIEHHLRNNAGRMGWTILRPTAFMDNLAPGFPARVFMAALDTCMGQKKLQWIATKDIGIFAKIVLETSEMFNHRAVGLAGAELTREELCEIVLQETGVSIYPTFSILGYVLKYMVPDMGNMVNWFALEGYAADIAEAKVLHPRLLDLKTWLKQESPFPKKA